MIEQDCVYMNAFRDALGKERRVPVLVISPNEYNESGMFCTTVRLSRVADRGFAPQHVHIPQGAFLENCMSGDSIALCETVSSTRKSTLIGPIARLVSAYYKKQVQDAIKYQVGISSEPRQIPRTEHIPQQGIGTERNQPWYSVAGSPQMRETIPGVAGAYQEGIAFLQNTGEG